MKSQYYVEAENACIYTICACKLQSYPHCHSQTGQMRSHTSSWLSQRCFRKKKKKKFCTCLHLLCHVPKPYEFFITVHRMPVKSSYFVLRVLCNQGQGVQVVENRLNSTNSTASNDLNDFFWNLTITMDFLNKIQNFKSAYYSSKDNMFAI